MQPRHVDQRPDDLSPERCAEVVDVSARVTSWATGRRDVLGLLLVGSCAEGTMRPESDLDLIMIVEDPDQYADGSWTGDLGFGKPDRVRRWGAVCEWRFRTSSGLEVEINIGPRGWARPDPIDAGTQRVVRGGACALYDPEGILRRLLAACDC